jgi:hypothetical protein
MSAAELANQATAEARHRTYANRILILLPALVSALALYRIVIHCVRYIRTLACINNPTQRYFKLPTPTFASIKDHLIYAPLLRTRHHREFRLFSASLGILPSRFQSIFCVLVIGMNVALSVCRIPWDGPHGPMLGQFRNRTGTLAVVNMIPLMVLAGRNNPLIIALNMPFETFNLVHRLFGRIVAAEAVAHVVVHLSIMINKGRGGTGCKTFMANVLQVDGTQ